MDDVLEQAGQLGKSMRSHERFRRLREAEAAVMGSKDSVLLAEALGALQERSHALAAEGKGLDEETKERLEKVATAAAQDPLLRGLWKAQQEFQELVDRVSAAMLAELKPEP